MTFCCLFAAGSVLLYDLDGGNVSVTVDYWDVLGMAGCTVAALNAAGQSGTELMMYGQAARSGVCWQFQGVPSTWVGGQGW
jgi:hypothetical protein